MDGPKRAGLGSDILGAKNETMDKTVLDALYEYSKVRLIPTTQQSADQRITEDSCWSYLQSTLDVRDIANWMDKNAPSWVNVY